jgi:hypothetical protein
MTPLKRAPLICRTASLLVCLACVACAWAGITATAIAATAIHFEHETLPALRVQLQHHQVHALSFHPATPTGHIHVSLNGGRHMTVAYATTEQTALLAIARADGTPVTIAQAKAKAVKPAAHHKLRYIAGGILVLVIIVVLAVLLIDRRRKLGETDGEDAGGTASSQT